MQRYSHIARIEEKKSRKRIYLSLISLLVISVILGLWGLPLMTKFSLLLTNRGIDTGTASDSNLPLLPPRLDPIAEATNSSTIAISGTALKGEALVLTINGEEMPKVLVGNDGTFMISDIRLREGQNQILGKVIRGDKASIASDILTIVYKKTPPKLEITDPSEGAVFLGEMKDITIRGITDSDTQVMMNDRLVIVANDGTFSVPYTLNDGENTLKVVTTDRAGNQTTILRKVTYKS